MSSFIAPLYFGAKFVGPAKTARIRPGENAAIHRAVHTAKRGRYPGCRRRRRQVFRTIWRHPRDMLPEPGHWGRCYRQHDPGYRRNPETPVPVFCLGAHPAATGKAHPGEIDVEIFCGRIRVRPGDFIAGDDDGVVVVPREIAQQVAHRASAIAEKEDLIRAQLARGETTCEIFGIDSLPASGAPKTHRKTGDR